MESNVGPSRGTWLRVILSDMQADEKIIQAMVTLLENEVAYGICLYAYELQTYQLHDGRFAVNSLRYDPETGKEHYVFEELFGTALEAATFFENKRRELGLW